MIFPVPTFAQRDCEKSTKNCSGHGYCDSSGTCQCFDNYYDGKEESCYDLSACSTLCEGDLRNGLCVFLRDYFIGGLFAYEYSDMKVLGI